MAQTNIEQQNLTPITEFIVSRKNIFLTGVTGFLGKVILYKLLSVLLEVPSSTTVISVLIRKSKKDVSPKERLKKEVFQTPIFESMSKEYPQFCDKVQVYEGDISIENFNLDSETLKYLQSNVDVILHGAATTKFTENLKLAFEVNVLAVRELLKFAKSCPNLISYVHVSTCYVNANKKNGQDIYEKIYPLPGKSYKELIDYVVSLSSEEAEKVTPSIIKSFPNTYTFSKSIGERVVQAEKGSLPLCIIRPSIVTGAFKEPLQGWVDSMLGASGLFIACGLGVLHVMKGSKHNLADFIPMDFVSNAILAAAWRNSILKCNWKESLPIYQIASSHKNPISWMWPLTIVPQYFRRYPPKKQVFVPSSFLVKNPALYKSLHILLHLLPAFTLDTIRTIQGKKKFMVKAITRLEIAISSLSYFTSTGWIFRSDNTDLLLNAMTLEDRQKFFFDVNQIQWDIYIFNYCGGVRKYLLQEDQESLPSKL